MLLLFLAFGIAFEMPVAVVLLVATGLVKVEVLKQQSRLRGPRHLYRRRLFDASRRDLADLHGGADVPAVRARHRVRAVRSKESRRRPRHA